MLNYDKKYNKSKFHGYLLVYYFNRFDNQTYILLGKKNFINKYDQINNNPLQYILPGGKNDNNETIVQTIFREFTEETGHADLKEEQIEKIIEIKPNYCRYYSEFKNKKNIFVGFYKATEYEFQDFRYLNENHDNELKKLCWFKIEHALDVMTNGIPRCDELELNLKDYNKFRKYKKRLKFVKPKCDLSWFYCIITEFNTYVKESNNEDEYEAYSYNVHPPIDFFDSYFYRNRFTNKKY